MAIGLSLKFFSRRVYLFSFIGIKETFFLSKTFPFFISFSFLNISRTPRFLHFRIAKFLTLFPLSAERISVLPVKLANVLQHKKINNYIINYVSILFFFKYFRPKSPDRSRGDVILNYKIFKLAKSTEQQDSMEQFKSIIMEDDVFILRFLVTFWIFFFLRRGV